MPCESKMAMSLFFSDTTITSADTMLNAATAIMSSETVGRSSGEGSRKLGLLLYIKGDRLKGLRVFKQGTGEKMVERVAAGE